MTRSLAAILLFFLLTIGAALGSSGCGSGSGSPSPAAGTSAPNPVATPAAAPAATFSQINSGILQPSCVQCHGSMGGSGGVDLSSYSGVMTQVSAGNPSMSALYNAVATGLMPRSGALPQSQVQQIQSWIAAGAPNN